VRALLGAWMVGRRRRLFHVGSSLAQSPAGWSGRNGGWGSGRCRPQRHPSRSSSGRASSRCGVVRAAPQVGRAAACRGPSAVPSGPGPGAVGCWLRSAAALGPASAAALRAFVPFEIPGPAAGLVDGFVREGDQVERVDALPCRACGAWVKARRSSTSRRSCRPARGCSPPAKGPRRNNVGRVTACRAAVSACSSSRRGSGGG